MKNFNLTELSLRNKSLIYYFIIVVFIMGSVAYTKLGRMEDPDFTIRQMIVTVAWPGATARQIEEQVTDKIEKKLQDLPGVDFLQSQSRPGSSSIYVTLREDLPTSAIRPSWLEARNMVNDMKRDLPEGVVGPFFNDRFDDVYGSIYALTGDGYSYEEMRQHAEKIRRMLLDVKSVRKVELLGQQTEKIYIEVENSRLAALGIRPDQLASIIKAQNSLTPAGMVETESDNVYLRMSGMFEDLDALRNLPIRVNGRTFRLSDIAKVTRGYIEPSESKMFFNGQAAIGIAVSMEEGGNILTLGEDLAAVTAALKQELPAGLEIHQVSDQPKVVKESISDFIRTLTEAIVIVLFVSFLSLGVRTGLVVALCIPLVIAAVFWAMQALGIALHKVSLGALIIALGLLVDDAIIAVEMMSVKLEEGYDRFKAACHAYAVTAMPMLTGTLITCAGFIPVGFSQGMAAEFTATLFPVIAIALAVSWLVSVMVAPLLGYSLIKVKPPAGDHQVPYQGKFYQRFRRLLNWCLEHRKTVLLSTIVSFGAAIFMLRFVDQEFFPPSTRPEIIVEMTLPEGASMKATEAEARRFASFLDGEESALENYSYYVGSGAPRFVLTTEPILPASNYAQFIVVAKDVDARIALTKKIKAQFADHFPGVRGNLKLIQTGPPAAYPVMLRVSGYDAEKVHALAEKVVAQLAQDPNLRQIHFNWSEKSKVIRLDVDQDKLRNLGIDSHSFALTLQGQLTGATIADYYDGDRTVDMVFRLASAQNADLSKIKDLPIAIGNGAYVPLSQIAKISYDAEYGLIWRRDLKPTITVQANIVSGTANDATRKAYEATKALRDGLAPGYSIKLAGALENSATAMEFMLAPIPAMILIILTLLMFQLQRIPLMLLTVLTAPLGIIGIPIGMIIFAQPMGFVAQLGILALSGMIIRNSVILIDQIQKHIGAGEDIWNAIINSAILRFRPIMLTAAAAILGMIPLMRSNFWGPMAVAIASGLVIATLLTLLVLPTMYAAWFKAKKP